jgi:hypothetical protein
LLVLAAIGFSATAFAQTAPPKVGNKPLAQMKPKGSPGCKFVGTVKGTKLWAGDCEAAELRSSVPATEAGGPACGGCRGNPAGSETVNDRTETRRTAAEESQLQEMLAAGMAAPEIARKLKRTAQAMYARLQRLYRKRNPSRTHP